MQRIIRVLHRLITCTVVLVGSFGSFAHASVAPEPSEYQRVVKVGFPFEVSDKKPYSYEDRDEVKALEAFLTYFWTRWAKERDYKLELVVLPRHQLKLELDAGKVDVIAISTLQDDDAGKYAYSIPYLDIKGTVYKRVNKVSQDNTKKLALHMTTELFPYNYNDENELIVHSDDVKDVAAHFDDVDYIYSWAGRILDRQLYLSNQLDNFTDISDSVTAANVPMRAIALKKNSDLVVDINRAIRDKSFTWSEQTPGESYVVANNFRSLVGTYADSFTFNQEYLLIERPVLTYAYIVDGEEPYFLTDGLFVDGYIPDLMKKLSEVIGVTFKAVPQYSFQEAVDSVRLGEVDIFPGVYSTERRAEYLDFSDTIDRSVLSIASEEDYYSINELDGLSLALIKGLHESDIAIDILPNNAILYVDTAEEALEAVANGRADAHIGKLLNSAYIINNLGLHTLELHKASDIESVLYPRIAMQSGNEVWIGLLNQALYFLGDDFEQLLQVKWKQHLVFSEDQERVQGVYEKIIIAMIVLFLILACAFVFYRSKLSRRSNEQHILKKALEEAKQARQDAEEMALAKSDFLARMSHEIRTPMNGVLGMAEALSFTKLDKEQAELLSTLNSSARNLMALLNDVLDFSKMDAGKLTLEMVSCELEPILTNVVGNFKHKATAKSLSFNSRTDQQLTKAYICDSTRLMQVMNNLVSNSIKFTNEGFVELSAQMVSESYKTETDGTVFDLISFQVRDSGIGIQEDKLATLFDPFVQADGDITRKFGGTGLGLSICNEIIAEMGGEIKVSSVMGKGSVFTIELCLQVDQANKNYRRAELGNEMSMNDLIGGTGISQLKVLFAEDNAVNRKVIGGQLKRLGVTFDVAENGLEAYNMYKANPHYDVVLSDCHMPEMDGFALVAALKRDYPNLDTVLIAITADALSGAASKCLQAGFDDYISKPCPIDILESKLGGAATKVLDGQSDFDTNDSSLSEWLDTIGSGDNAEDVTESDAPSIPDLPTDSAQNDALEEDFNDWLSGFDTEPNESPVNEEPLKEEAPQVSQHDDFAMLQDIIEQNSVEEEQAFVYPPIEPFNIDHVMEMSGEIEEIAQEIMDTFVVNYQQDIEDIKRARDNRIAEPIRETAHRIKGSALYLGDQPLATVAKQLEVEAGNDDLTELDGRVDFIVEAIELLAEQVHHSLIDMRGE